MKGSRRPHRVRRHQWQLHWIEAIVELRKENPYWGKAKIRRLLIEQGIELSESMVGRIISYLIKRHRIVRADGYRKKLSSGEEKRPYTKRGYAGLGMVPGDAVQVDTMTISREGCVIKQFTATDVATRFTAAQLYSRATAKCASSFLHELQDAMPFSINCIQVDGGSEFKGEFESSCQALGIKLVVLPPRCPQMNSRVEYVHGTCRREFWRGLQNHINFTVSGLRPHFQEWLTTYNTIRPHTNLDMMTPKEYIEHYAASEVGSS